MAEWINASGGSGGGTGSDDVTATRDKVLEKFTAVTHDSDDEPVSGTMQNLTDRATVTHTTTDKTKVIGADNATVANNSDGVRRIELRYNGSEGFIKPNTLIAYPEAQAGVGFGITADKIANGQVVLGMTGTYKGLGNATSAQVLTGYSFSTATLSNAPGTMPNNGAWGTNIGINGSVVIPAGYHNGTGRVGQSVPVKGATTITPRNYQQTAVGAGTYCSGNIIVAGDGNFVAGNIKKGVSIWGTYGTFEGYVPTATDLYLRGNNIAGFYTVSGSAIFHSGMIEVVSRLSNLSTGKVYNLSGYKSVNIEGKSTASSTMFLLLNADGNTLPGTDWGTSFPMQGGVAVTSLNGYSATTKFMIRNNNTCFIYRIWLS